MEEILAIIDLERRVPAPQSNPTWLLNPTYRWDVAVSSGTCHRPSTLSCAAKQEIGVVCCHNLQRLLHEDRESNSASDDLMLHETAGPYTYTGVWRFLHRARQLDTREGPTRPKGIWLIVIRSPYNLFRETQLNSSEIGNPVVLHRPGTCIWKKLQGQNRLDKSPVYREIPLLLESYRWSSHFFGKQKE